MISLKNYKQNLLALFACCALVPCSSNGASQQIQQSLHKACALGDVPTVQRLIQDGVDVNDQDKNGCTPLLIACAANNLSIVQLLINRGAHANAQSNCFGTPLHVACKYNKLPIVQLLIDSGADVNTKDKDDCTALHIACDSNNSEIVERLIQNGADVNAQDIDGSRPFSKACAKDNVEIARLLACHGAIVNRVRAQHYSPTVKACINDIYNTDVNFNPLTTPATLELLQRLIACDSYTAYVLKHFLTQPQDIQKELVKHALLHNQDILIQFYPYTNCDQLLTPNMLADNTYLQQKYADYRKKLPLQTKANWWNTKALPFTNTTITFNK